jgi:SAM-dependent methyltransferase
MKKSGTWYRDDDLWHTWGPMLFSPQRIANASFEVSQVLALVDIPRKAKILDLCCGTGRHSLELARRGYKVTGVDRTREYLEQAGEQAAKEGLKVDFIQEDMKIFRQPDTFDLVINLFTSFGFFEDQADDRKMIDNIFCSLKPGGTLVMDLSGKEVLARDFRERDWREVEGVFWLEERKVASDWGSIQSRWIMFKDDRRYENTINLRLYSAAELTGLLRASGFSSASAYGDLDGSPYDNRARRLVVVSKKQ